MATVKTPILTGIEVCVNNLGGQNVAVKNLGDGSVYASTYPNIVPDADNVIEIPAGWGEVVLDARGTVYLLGVGKVQCTGTDYAYPNFKLPPSSEGGGGGTGGDVTKGYVDAQDTTNLTAAKAYTDATVNAVKSDVTKNSDDISALKVHVTDAAATAGAAQESADAAGMASAAAQTTAEANAVNISALQEAMATARSEISGNTAAIAGNTSDIGELQSDLITAQTDIEAADGKAEAADTKAAMAEAKAETALSAVEDISAKSVISKNGAFDLRFYDDKLQAKAGDEWTDITTGGGTAGGVSQAYVDTRDAVTLTAANAYTDSKISPLRIAVDDNTENIGTLTNKVTEAEGAIERLNGTGEGSVKKTAADEVAKIVADAPESLNSLGKIAAWIAEHPEDAAALNELIQQNKQDIADINNETTGILAKAGAYTDKQLAPVNNSISNLQSGKADKTEIPTTLPANGGNADTVGGHTVMTNVPENANFTATNPNLLDNWYFADPINQRGKKEYTTPGYTIDRWRLISGGIANGDNRIELTANGVKGETLTDQTALTFRQYLENPSDFNNKTVTLSALFSENSNAINAIHIGYKTVEDDTIKYFGKTQIKEVGLATVSAKLPGNLSELFAQVYPSDTRINPVGGYSVISAIKLELGEQQTLAHQVNGKWVLNDPPPNKALELLKCQRYFYAIRALSGYRSIMNGTVVTTGTARLIFTLPTEMRTTPKLVTGEGFEAALIGNGIVDTISADDISFVGLRGNIAYINILTTDIPQSYLCNLCLRDIDGSYIVFDADL